ncbi:MAG: DEAD/DEAH box helicase [Coriobacteriia bacterium]|nr:DEAD/DEAH box helicase [Coriobacteriia bacterium]
MSNFAELGLSPEILAAVNKLGYETPSPVQAQAIPFVLEGRNVVACAQTGTGKTAAFMLPLMQLISHSKGKGLAPRALIVSPVRELAAQIEKVARTVARQKDLRVGVVVGGVKYGPQLDRLARGVDVLVATPGRLIDLMSNKHVDLTKIEILVLDEADRMLDMGFWPQIQKIMAQIPERSQKLLFSATIGREIDKMVDTHMPNPVRVEIARKGMTADKIAQVAMPVVYSQKSDLLVAVIDRIATGKTLVFTRTKRRADNVTRILRKTGVRCEAIHGDRSQAQRTRALEQFTNGKIDVLVTTDVIARGIDVKNIDHVINYDTPANPEDYIHRIGRTGRAGASGNAITFLSPEEINDFRNIEYLTGQLIPVDDLEEFPYGPGRIVPREDRSVVKKKEKPFSQRRGGGRSRYGRR